MSEQLLSEILGALKELISLIKVADVTRDKEAKARTNRKRELDRKRQQKKRVRDMVTEVTAKVADVTRDKSTQTKAPPDPRLKPLTEALVAQYLKARGTTYVHGGVKDVMALKRLLDNFSPADIEARWKEALVRTGWPQVSTIAQLGLRWNDLAASVKNAPPKTEVWKEGDGTYSEEIKF